MTLVTKIFAQSILAAILAIFPHSPNFNAIQRNSANITAHIADAQGIYGVPAGVFAVVGFMETHLGTDANEGGGYGAPTNRFHRHTPGTADDAARALRRAYFGCYKSWEGAISRFRSGMCVIPATDYRRPYVVRALSLITQVYAHVGQAVPPEIIMNSPTLNRNRR